MPTKHAETNYLINIYGQKFGFRGWEMVLFVFFSYISPGVLALAMAERNVCLSVC